MSRWWTVAAFFALSQASVHAEDIRRSADADSFFSNYCTHCHNSDDAVGGVALDAVESSELDAAGSGPAFENHELWEKVIAKLRHRQMPPESEERPDESTYASMIEFLETSVDRSARQHPNPGRTESLRRLNRTEYQNSIRDLLSIDVDATSLLPHDESGHGFDNVNVGEFSPTLLDRYVSAAQKISRLAIGGGSTKPQSDIIRVKADVTQEEHVPGLPIGTRGGALIQYNFPQYGEYDVQVWLSRDRNEEVEGLKEPHEVEVLLDRERIARFTVKPPTGRKDYSKVDKHLRVRIPVSAGPHQLGVTFPRSGSSLLETARKPLQSHYNLHRHPRKTPAVFQVSITGPFEARASRHTPSRRRIFIRQPEGEADELACAREILSALLRRAYRRPVSEDDLAGPLEFYHEGRAEGDFDRGIERALAAILVSPEFLFRIERDPPNVGSGEPYRITDLELASRLAFFLWSSLPDDELLEAADDGSLSDSEGLENQVRRMLADPRSLNLATNFAGQWLHLRKLESFRPDARVYPDFDDNLRQAFREETERFFDSILREDRSVLDLLSADYTYLNERLAKHYQIPYVYGTRFRRVDLDSESHRGGLLRHGSILTVTSFATRTSPVLRGTWVLENIFGSPPPPPPPDVPALENSVAADLPMRARLSAHRDTPACAGCHATIDPVGFALENFDAVGRWRIHEEDGTPIDSSGGLPGTGQFDGVAGLEQGLLNRPELFAETLTKKLLTFALGRGVEYYDAPAVREILREAQPDGYRLSSLVLGIAKSAPFQMRTSKDDHH